MSQSERIARTIDVANETVTFSATNSDGKTFTRTIRASDFSPAVRAAAMLHGLNSTIGDAAALETREIDGKMHRPTIAEKFNAMDKRVGALLTGVWSAPAVTSAGKVPVIIAALMELSGGNEDETRAEWEKLSADERKAVTSTPELATIIARIRAERAGVRPAANKPDATSILSRFKK